MRYFECKTCEDAPELIGTNELKTHLSEAHPGTPLKGSRKGILFMDGSNWYRNVFEWTLGGVKILEVDTNQ